jgi:glycerophosphoryl diester phosphodiesterase
MVENDLSSRKAMNARANTPLIIGHRGASALAPENTLTAFKRAIDDGAEGIEFDVRLSRDGDAVVFHDATLERTGRRTEAILDLTAAELGEIDIGSWFNLKNPAKANPEFADETVSTLAKTLNLLKYFSGLIYIELKCDPGRVDELCRAVCNVLGGSHLLPQIIVKSFELSAIPHIRRLCPEVETAALFSARVITALQKETRIIQAAKAVGAHQISVHYSLATSRLMRLAEGLPVTIWTADSPRWVRRGVDLGLMAIITNDPGRLLKEKRKVSAKS